MNYVKLWRQTENHLVLNDSVNLMENIKQNNHIKFVRAKIKSWNELCDSYCGSNTECDYIRIREDNMDFAYDMKKFCGEEFEIAINLNEKHLFNIIDSRYHWIITRHMVDITESKDYEINKNYQVIQMPVKSIIIKMWNELYNNCNKLDKKILDKLINTVYESDRKIVIIKSWEELANEYRIIEDGIKIDEEDSMFYNEMRALCGKEFIAEYRDDSYRIGQLVYDDSLWEITRKMVTQI